MLQASPYQVALAFLSRQPCIWAPLPWCACCASTNTAARDQATHTHSIAPHGLRWLHRLEGEAQRLTSASTSAAQQKGPRLLLTPKALKHGLKASNSTTASIFHCYLE